jgi:F-type H+-transporting ATPase subunit epsilon
MEILTPERSFFVDMIESFIFETEDGEMSIQKGHESMVVTVIPSEVRINTGNKWLVCTVAEGFIEIRPDETIMFTQAA